jgi:putative tryptophan/tyrosine transport system substrate-binding protein
MKRREIITGLLLAATFGRAQAQQKGKVYHIALVDARLPVIDMSETSSDPAIARAYRAFFDELRRLGYVEGQNIVVDMYSGEGRTDGIRSLARELVRRNPDVIYTLWLELLFELKAATATIPIVFLLPDSVALGVVPNLARPGGNITGTSVDVGFEGWGKRIDLLREAIPTLTRLGFLAVRNVIAPVMKEVSEKRHVSLVGSPLESGVDEAAYSRAFAVMAQEGADAVFISDEPELNSSASLRLIVELAEKHRLPAVYMLRAAVEIGGLMAYSIELLDLIQHNADVIDQILKGTKPGEIPVYQARKFELAINLKTAKTLGLEIPLSLLARADEVIE